MDYLTGIYNTVENILDNEVSQKVSEEKQKELMEIYNRIDDYEFKKEEIRKAVQLSILKGFKHRNIHNGDMTPDSIAIFMNYLVNKFFDKKELKVLDPLVGTSNLLATIANNSENSYSFIGVDQSEEMIKISQCMMELLGYESDFYLQDSLTGIPDLVDLIVSDLPDIAVENDYLPGEVVKKYISNLKPEMPLIALVPNTFFDNASKEEIMENANLEGLIKLPDSLFQKGYEKSILILTRKGTKERTEFLLLDLESITDRAIVTDAMATIDNFFKRR